MSGNSEFKNFNFVSNTPSFTNLPSEQNTLEDKFISTLYYFSNQDKEFDFQTVPKEELKELSNFFYSKIILEKNNESLMFKKIYINNEKYVISTLTVSLFFRHMTDLINSNNNLNNLIRDYQYQLDNLFNDMFVLCDTIVDASIKIGGLHGKIRVKSQSMEYIYVIQNYIKLFHQMDRLIEFSFKFYLFIRKNFNFLTFIFDRFQDNEEYRASKQLLVKNTLEYANSSFKDYFTNESPITEYLNFNQPTPKIIVLAFHHIESLLFWNIELKVKLFESIIKFYNQSNMSNMVYNALCGYFKRFDELSLLRLEMIHDISVDYAINTNRPDYIYDDDLGSIIRECHIYLITNPDMIILEEEVNNSAYNKNILKFLKQKPKFYNFYFKQIDVLNTIKYCITKNINDFFSKKFREKFIILSTRAQINPLFECYELINLFRTLGIDNQSRCILIFDHILELSSTKKEVSLSYLLGRYTSILINDNKDPNRILVDLFRRLFNLYNNGQLFIPDKLINTVCSMEAHFCYDGFVEDLTPSNSLLATVYKSWFDINLSKSNFGYIKSCLDNIDFCLSNKIKKLFIDACTYDKKFSKFVINDDKLINAYFEIPKPQRIVLSFLISHLIKINQVLENKSEYQSYVSAFTNIILKFKKPNNDTKDIMEILLDRLVYIFRKNPNTFIECSRNVNYFNKISTQEETEMILDNQSEENDKTPIRINVQEIINQPTGENENEPTGENENQPCTSNYLKNRGNKRKL